MLVLRHKNEALVLWLSGQWLYVPSGVGDMLNHPVDLERGRMCKCWLCQWGYLSSLPSERICQH